MKPVPSSASPSAPLSALQTAYRSDPDGYRNCLQERGDRLFEQGYRADAAAIPCVFSVSREARGTDPWDAAVSYLVHAIKGTCTCPFYTRQRREPLTWDGSIVPCKHLLGLEKLVRLSAAAYRAAGERHRYFRLRSHWLGVLAERCRYSTGVSLVKGESFR